jgi:hypothetical protein
MTSSDKPRIQWTLTILVALALVAVAAGVFASAYALARRGTFDALLRHRTPTVVAVLTQRPPTPTVRPAHTVSPTSALAPTMTPKQTTPSSVTPPAPTSTAVLAATSSPTPTVSPTPQPTADPRTGKFLVTYLGCDPRGSDIGIVKGQILDSRGKILVGAEVRITLDDWTYDQPAVSNGEGWYEFYLQKGLKVKIASLRINGAEMPLLGEQDQVFLSQGGCFEHVNLVQQ